jgi:Polyketide cyclase / dehydrase and lipid transport
MELLKFTTRIRAPHDRAFRLLVTAERFPEWFPKVRAITDVTAPLDQPGARYTLRFRGMPDAKEEVLEVVPNALHRRKFVQVSGGVGAHGITTLRFRPVGVETDLEFETEYDFLPAFLAPVISALLRTQAERAMRAEIASLAAFIEREVSKVSNLEPGTSRHAPSSSVSNAARA